MRAVTNSDVLADARVVRLGRTMSFGRVTLLGATDNKPVAMVSGAFAMLQLIGRDRPYLPSTASAALTMLIDGFFPQ